MAKFARSTATIPRSPLTASIPAPTHEGGDGAEYDLKAQLFLLALTNMVREGTFYEKAGERDARFRDLVHRVTATDPDWVKRFVPFLRDTMNMRSASLVLAAEYVKAGGPNGRQVVASALQRADEPGEMLAYWTQVHGRAIPQPVKRGVADAACRLYTERAVVRYDGLNAGWRFGSVLEVVHPKPRDHYQSFLFKHLIDRAHDRDGLRYEDGEDVALRALANDAMLRGISEDQRRGVLGSSADLIFNTAYWPWERLAGWLPGGMDKEAWEAVIPSMGLMALVRNLRNFDQAGVNDGVAAAICRRLTDPEEVKASRQMPFRFYSAYAESPSERWSWALEKAMDLSMANVPSLKGSTLVLIDISGSMADKVSERSQRSRAEIAALFGISLAKRAEQAQVVMFNNQWARYPVTQSVLRCVKGISARVTGGTNTGRALRESYQGEDRVVILTDEQASVFYGEDIKVIRPQGAKRLYTWNLAGYDIAQTEQGKDNCFVFGGLSDGAFTGIDLIESTGLQSWPF